MAERPKQTPCPHCKVVGTLNRHGSLLRYDESSPQQRMVRARRVFLAATARHARLRAIVQRLGAADKIRRLSLTTVALWRFLQAAVASGIFAASSCRWLAEPSGPGNGIWKRFDPGQSQIRITLRVGCRFATS